MELGTGRVAPYIEAGVGNSLADSTKYHRTYTTLGYVAPFASGLIFDLGHNLSFDASTYYDLPFGEQKLYSRVVQRGVTVPVGTRTLVHRPIASQFFSQGGASLTEDHGYNGSLAFSPTKRVLLSVNYNRSIPDALDAVSATLSVRFGHMASKAGQSER
jgi:hypothetical protein